MAPPIQPLQWDYLATVPYTQAWSQQRQLREQRIQEMIPDTLLLLQHPPTITLGRHRGEKSLHSSPEQLEQQGVTVIRSDRGGDATLHAPGQLVGYTIVHLGQRQITLPRFVEILSEVFIELLEALGIQAHYDPKYPGVWVGKKKIVAFGLHLRQNVTMHGFAFNINTALSLFDLIIPCGLHDRGVTSVRQLLPQHQQTIENWATQLAETIATRLQLQPQQTPLRPSEPTKITSASSSPKTGQG